jgi:hypothetical protein
MRKLRKLARLLRGFYKAQHNQSYLKEDTLILKVVQELLARAMRKNWGIRTRTKKKPPVLTQREGEDTKG